MKLTELKTLSMAEPLGIDTRPHFSWITEDAHPNMLQNAYRIVVKNDQDTVWDTGRVQSRQQAFIPYQGTTLESRTQYVWTVTIWDDAGKSCEASSWFETALLQKADWCAQWIGSSIPREKTEYQYGSQPPPVLFTKAFQVEKTVAQARLYTTAYGVYHAYLNGVRPDDREFAPEHTVYRSLLYYQTYDVTHLLHSGENQYSMYVGDGWFFCPQTQPVGIDGIESPAVLFQLEISYEDGSMSIIASDGSEHCGTGPVLFSDLFRGEKQDANIASHADKPVLLLGYGYSQLAAQPMPPVRPVKLVPAVEAYVSPKGEHIVDFGQLLCGRARIKVCAPKGTQVVFEYFEVPDTQGNYFNSMYADQKDIYVSDGGCTTYEALFTYHGFRYIRVTGLDTVERENFTAVLLTTDNENTSTFECSDNRLMRLYQNIRWSQANNMLSIPTDCPSREKGGFTGDIQIYAQTALLNENMTPFLTSWLRNLAADQTSKGVVPITVPLTKVYENIMRTEAERFGDEGLTGVAGWSDAAVIVPYQMYMVTGNTLVLEQCYTSMRKWCDYVIRTAREKRGDAALPEQIDQYLWNTGFHFGEWLIPSQKDTPDVGYSLCKLSAAYTAPIFGYLSVQLMAETARILHKEEHGYYRDMALQMKQAIQQGVMKDGRMPQDFMGAYVLAIALDLVPDAYRQSFSQRLVNLIESNDGCLDTGFLATPYLLDALDKIGRRDLALQTLWQAKQPSWLYEVDHGATAIWESWFGLNEQDEPKMTSYDHYAFGCVDEWIFRCVAGIQADEAGYRHITISPDTTAGLAWCKRSFKSPYGWIKVFWTQDEIKISIPCNTTATVIWKNTSHTIGSGKYTFN